MSISVGKLNQPALLAFIIAFLVSFTSTDQESIITYPFQGEVKSITNKVMPQGWGFFTKSVEADHYKYYFKDGDNYKYKSRGQNSSFQYFIGFNRASRIGEVENSYLLKQIPDDAWKECQSLTINECSENYVDNSVGIENKYRERIYCGNFLISVEKTVPWEWREYQNSDIPHPEKIVLVNIKC